MKLLSRTIAKLFLLGFLVLLPSVQAHDHDDHDDHDHDDHDHDELWHGHVELGKQTYTLNLQRPAAGEVRCF